MRRNKFLLTVALLVLSSAVLPAGISAPVTVRIEASPQIALETLPVGYPIMVDIYMENVGETPLAGIFVSLRFRGNNGVTSVTPVNPGTGLIYLGNVGLLNGFGGDEIWDKINEVTGFSWDGTLPDTLGHFGASMFGGWPNGLGEMLHYRFGFEIDQPGTLCIEWIDPNIIWDGIIIDPLNVVYFSPKCWAVIESYLCGNAYPDSQVDLLDIIQLIWYLYGDPPGPAPEPLEAGDANADGDLNILDILYLISYIYDDPPGPAPLCP
ncbi:MAG: hypothetical protein JSV44_06085 [Candidatus Zixiibacteriota bacterium]|nr:MAG: hypothetical protein JSV44_06085 [candidate division Zixibacteria bacterium]